MGGAPPSPPAELTSATLIGLWWDAKGDYTRAHESAQLLDEGPESAGVHPYRHRKEGIVGRLGLADDFIGPHHFVVFVLENVAMPDVAEFISRVYLRSRREIEAGDHTRDVT